MNTKEPELTTEGKIDYIFYKIKNEIDPLLRMLIKKQRSNKTEMVRDLAIERTRITTRQIMDTLGLTRAWAIEQMRKLGQEPDFRYIPGEATKNSSSALIYSKAISRERQHNLIFKEIEKNKELSLFKISKLLNVDVDGARIVVSDLVTEYPRRFVVKDGNKLSIMECYDD